MIPTPAALPAEGAPPPHPLAPTWTRDLPLDPTWNSWVGVHGGYLAASVAEGAASVAPGHAIRSIHALFPRPVTGSRALLAVHAVYVGRGAGFLEGEVRTESGAPGLRMQILTGTDGAGPCYPPRPAPAAVPIEECEPFAFPVELVPFTQHLDIRPANDARPLAGGDRAELVAWVRPWIGGLGPAQTMLVLTDALPPALYAVLDAPTPIPSADLAVHLTPLAARAAPGDWYLVRIATEAAGDGWSIDGSHVWSRHGELLASGRQMRRVLG